MLTIPSPICYLIVIQTVNAYEEPAPPWPVSPTGLPRTAGTLHRRRPKGGRLQAGNTLE
ncbi:hypothetical protein COMA2_180091 [Candidatus Nitrospira nitrificans]|uniref:Uncharacterized protein n=1 Tax=Candidatus Nitrospira nitrificans TaxID=1742973 RepID=A0A0S4LB31_9BACT|nr:hypothetical protein COMA2_180091 [Candidatus Nitrospira nitrificans]